MKNKNPIWQDRIVTNPLILAGNPTIKGTRISVELIMELLDGDAAKSISFVCTRTSPRRISEPVGITPPLVQSCPM